MDAHARLFQRIAPVYRWFFGAQTRAYRQVLSRFRDILPPGGKALDIGCGPGAFTRALYTQGLDVTGVDFAPAMIVQARRLSPSIPFFVGDGRDLPFADKSFDLITAAYVAHGLDPGGRITLYREAARLSRARVILHDFSLRSNPLVSLVELLEGGNYFSFCRSGLEEMQSVFARVEVAAAGPRSDWYICSPNSWD